MNDPDLNYAYWKSGLDCLIKVAAILALLLGIAVYTKPQNDANKLEREKYEHAVKVLDSLVAPGLGIRVSPELHTDRPFNL